MQVIEQFLGERHVLGTLGQKGVEPRLVPPCRVEPAIDPKSRDQTVETEPAAANAHRSPRCSWGWRDLIGGAGNPVAARGAGIADHGMDLDFGFLGAAADVRGDQIRLHGGATGAFDVQDDRLAAGGVEGFVDEGRGAGEVEQIRGRTR